MSDPEPPRELATDPDSTIVEGHPLSDPDGVAAVSAEQRDPSVILDEADPPAGAAEARAASRLPSILESLLFAADHPLTAQELAALVEEPDKTKIEGALALLGAEWSSRGVQLHPVAGGWQLHTNPANAVWVQRLVAQKPVRLARSQLETMAIIAYRQPITRPEIDEIRGVDSGATLKTLLERSLVRILGKKEEPGRPLLYGTTKEFLEFFNLRDLRELPTLREFHELSDEHRAQVEALARAASPGTVDSVGPVGPVGPVESERRVAPDTTMAPLGRVELSDAPIEEDLGEIDQLIEEAGARARGAGQALGTAIPESEAQPHPSPPPADDADHEKVED